MNFNFLITIILLATGVKGQHHEGVVQIHILDTVLVTNVHDLRISVRLDFKNESDSTFLLYGSNGDYRTLPAKIEQLNNHFKKMSAGRALYVYDSSMKKMFSNAIRMMLMEIAYKPMPEEKFDSLTSVSRARYLKGTKVIKGFETLRLRSEIDLKEFELKKGTYSIRMVYFSGPETACMVDPEQIAKDKKTYKAFVYKGITVSNEIRVRVE